MTDVPEAILESIARIEAWAKGLAETGAPHQVPLGKDGLSVVAHVRALHGAAAGGMGRIKDLENQLDQAHDDLVAANKRIASLQDLIARYEAAAKTDTQTQPPVAQPNADVIGNKSEPATGAGNASTPVEAGTGSAKT